MKKEEEEFVSRLRDLRACCLNWQPSLSISIGSGLAPAPVLKWHAFADDATF